MTNAARRPGCGEQGFVLIGVLVALTLSALLAVHSGQRLADARQRECESELLGVGEQYRQAIQSYWRESPGGVRVWPTKLEDLVEDRRFPMPRRHLRKLYVDPLSPDSPWGLLKQGSAIIGVYSQTAGTPFRQTGFGAQQRGFDGAQGYEAWRFIAEVAPAAPGQAAKPAPPGIGPAAKAAP